MFTPILTPALAAATGKRARTLAVTKYLFMNSPFMSTHIQHGLFKRFPNHRHLQKELHYTQKIDESPHNDLALAHVFGFLEFVVELTVGIDYVVE